MRAWWSLMQFWDKTEWRQLFNFYDCKRFFRSRNDCLMWGSLYSDRLSLCDLVSAVKPLAGFLWHSV
jgi:hypothetical protein